MLLRMATVTFDTLKFVETLTSSGIPEEQAKALARAFSEAQESAQLATKADLRELELRLTLKLGTMMAASIGIVATLVKLL
jgi:hypothetical protein